MHSELSYGLSFAPKLQRVGTIHLSGSDQPTPDPSFSHAVEAETEQRSRRRARQSIREYELIWLLQQRLRAVSWPHWRLRCMQPLHGHGMGVVRP